MTGADWVIVAVIVRLGDSGRDFRLLSRSLRDRRLGFWVFAGRMELPAAGSAVCALSEVEWLGEIAAFLIIFLAVLVLAGIAGRITRHIVKEAGLSFVDRILGGALGLLRGILMVAVILMSMAAFTPTSQWLEGSELAPYFLVVGRAAIWVAPSELRARFYQGLDLLRREQQHK